MLILQIGWVWRKTVPVDSVMKSNQVSFNTCVASKSLLGRQKFLLPRKHFASPKQKGSRWPQTCTLREIWFTKCCGEKVEEHLAMRNPPTDRCALDFIAQPISSQVIISLKFCIHSMPSDSANSKRTPLPSCVMAFARAAYPEKDGKYTGFKSRENVKNQIRQRWHLQTLTDVLFVPFEHLDNVELDLHHVRFREALVIGR